MLNFYDLRTHQENFEVIKKNKLTYTSYNNFKKCEKKYFFANITGYKFQKKTYKTFKGILRDKVRSVLTSRWYNEEEKKFNKFFNNNIYNVIEDALQSVCEDLLENPRININKINSKFIIEKNIFARDVYREFKNKFIDKKSDFKSSKSTSQRRYEINIELDDPPIKGIIDEYDGKKLIEHKSGKEEIEHREQLLFYYYLLINKKKTVYECEISYSDKKKKIIFDEYDLKKIDKNIRQVIIEINSKKYNQDYEPSTGDQCNKCEFNYICPSYWEINKDIILDKIKQNKVFFSNISLKIHSVDIENEEIKCELPNEYKLKDQFIFLRINKKLFTFDQNLGWPSEIRILNAKIWARIENNNYYPQISMQDETEVFWI